MCVGKATIASFIEDHQDAYQQYVQHQTGTVDEILPYEEFVSQAAAYETYIADLESVFVDVTPFIEFVPLNIVYQEFVATQVSQGSPVPSF